MSKHSLLEMAARNAAQVESGTIELVDSVARIPAEHYFDEERWRLEMKQVFKRLPLMLATTSELREPGDYKTSTIAGIPVLLSRGKNGELRAFINMCSHRGAVIMTEGSGNSHRFTCPYHAWNYNLEGELVGIYNEKEFGEVDKSCHGLRSLPVEERSGLVWVILDPDSTLDIAQFLSGYDEMLSHFGFESWHMFSQRTVRGPNWKIAYDGYLDFYHLPILHKETFGSDFPSRANYDAWGPHQRVSSPDPVLAETPQAEWSMDQLLTGVWTIFPHISIASFDGGGRGVLISQLFPGDTPGESFTVQNYLMEKPPATAELEKSANEQFEFLKFVVEEEDYATGLRQQQALKTGARDHVMFGRNEGGGQSFHQWLDRVLNTSDEDLNTLFDSKNN
jgi:phenylpropionate dioxygenase-like ring-hydroxylating dioxygenase large terminal subunit